MYGWTQACMKVMMQIESAGRSNAYRPVLYNEFTD